MMSATVMLWMRRPTTPARPPRRPPGRGSRRAGCRSPRASRRRWPAPTARARRAAAQSPVRRGPVACVARLRSPVRHQIAACAIRPPSSGKAGTRLNTSTSALIVATQLSHTSAGVARDVAFGDGHFEEALAVGQQPAGDDAGDDHRERHQRSGDRHANSVPGSLDSSVRVMPPSAHRSMPATAARCGARPARDRARAGPARRRTTAPRRRPPGRRSCASRRAVRGRSA